MLLEAIYHRAQSPYVYMYQKDVLHIRLRTKKDDVESVRCFYGDPFLWEDNVWRHEECEMTRSGRDELFDYWFVSLSPHWKRLRYGFALKKGDECLYFFEKGFSHEKPNDIGPLFCFPYLHENVFQPPEWVKDTVWYQVFPDRFHNGEKENDPKTVEDWGGEPKPNNFFGGDIQGMIEKVEYLKELGISGVYLTPIFQAPSNHKYDTIDYFQIDPQFGTPSELKQFVSICHEHGIKVMLDAVFNHCGYHFPPFQDVLKNGETSRYKDWFFIHRFPVETEPKPNYETFSFEKMMPKLNTNHPEVEDYLLNVATYWVEQFDIDGWRLDVANEVDHSFWRKFRENVKKKKKDLFIVGEVWHDAIKWLDGDQFDSVMNYPFADLLRQYFLQRTISTREFMTTLERIHHAYPQTVTDVLFNLVGSHDTERVATTANNRHDVLRLLFAFLLSYPGTPCIYYGDEIGLTGGPDPGCRPCMPWEEDIQAHELFQFMKKMIQLRSRYSLLRNEGQLLFHEMSSDVLLFTKTNGDNRLISLFNNNETEMTLTLPFSLRNRTIKDIWTENEFAANADTLSITLAPMSFRFLFEKGEV